MPINAFPTLPGQGITVHKKPKWNTTVASHASGRESRNRRYQWPLWDFELTFDGLDATDSGYYSGLGADTMQQLAGFFNRQAGAYVPFAYIDPTDNTAVAQQIGVGDGATIVFTLTRSIGPFTGPVDLVTAISAVYFDGVSQATGWSVTNGFPSPFLTFTSAPGSTVKITVDFTYAYLVRFSDDVQDFEEFMTRLMMVKEIKFQSVRIRDDATVYPMVGPQLLVYIIDDVTVTSFPLPAGLIQLVSLQGYGGGGGGSAPGVGITGHDADGGGGAAYAVAPLPAVTAGDVLEIVVGAPGTGGPSPNSGGNGGDSTVHTSGGTLLLRAKGANAAPNKGLASGCVPTLNAQDGGQGGGGGSRVSGGARGSGGGGGGAGGPLGPGQDGAAGSSTLGHEEVGAGGGAGSGGMPGSGQTGGAAANGSPGGGPGLPGADGSGGGGGVVLDPTHGGPGGDGGDGIGVTGIPVGASDSSGGPGGGAGAAAGSSATAGGDEFGGDGADGGKWGGGGGGGGSGAINGSDGSGGVGGVGAIIITLWATI